MKKIMISSALAGALLLTACSSKPLMTDRDVLVAQNRGELQTMYDQIQQELQLEKPSSERAANLRHYHEMVGEKIANEKEARILNGLDRDVEKQTISRLQQAKNEAGVLAKITRILAQKQINIESIVQKEHPQGNAHIVVITNPVGEQKFRACLNLIQEAVYMISIKAIRVHIA